MNKILWQKIGGGIEYHYLSSGEVYRGFGYDHATAKAALFRKLGWPASQFDRAQFIRF